jgi:hypothetical protein
MDIKDVFETSSKEELRSLVRVHELDEITSNGGKDRSVIKEHPQGLKRKRPDFMQGEPPYWTRGWHRQNGGSGGGKVHKCMRTQLRHYFLSSTYYVACQTDIIKYMLQKPILSGKVGKWAYALDEYDLHCEPIKSMWGQNRSRLYCWT